MRGYFYRLVLAITLASGTFAGSIADADPDTRDHRKDRDRDTRDHRDRDRRDRDTRRGKYDDDQPREAPPPARAERPGRRRGFVFVAGHWDWQRGKGWVWTAGRYEKARPGRKVAPARWEKKGDVYVKIDLSWNDAGAPPPPREERIDARPGWVFVRGHWEWDDGSDKWEWKAGRWEKERAGKRWREAKWDRSGDDWVFVDGGWDDGPPVAVSEYPTQAPPPPRVVRIGPRPGYVYLPGRWKWVGGKWDWSDGTFVVERKGERWREGRWENRNSKWEWTEGSWETDRRSDDAYPTQPPPPPPADVTPRLGPDDGWVPGRFEWRGGKYLWKSGFIERGKRGQRFQPGSWTRRGDRFEWVDGQWVTDTTASQYPTSAPPPLKDERGNPKQGEIWVKGRWEWKGGKWEWSGGRIERERDNEDWVDGKWQLMKSGRWEWSEGRWDKFPEWPTQPPPPKPVEQPQTKPGHGWRTGFYEWRRGKYNWKSGVLVPNREGQRHIGQEWVKKGNDWRIQNDRWEPDPSYKAPVKDPYKEPAKDPTKDPGYKEPPAKDPYKDPKDRKDRKDKDPKY